MSTLFLIDDTRLGQEPIRNRPLYEMLSRNGRRLALGAEY
jgi:hypothetical protein